MKCTHCGSEMQGEVGSRVCSNMNCRAYEVNKDNYDLPRSKRKDLKNG
jgi:hypothetical protein